MGVLIYNEFVPKDLPEKLTEEVQVSFLIPDSGLYSVSITARCRGKNDLRVEIDGRLFRETPPEKDVQKYNIPPAWNGSKLKGLRQTNIFLIRLSKGEHTIAFYPQGQVTIEDWTYRQIEDSSNMTFDLGQQAEDGDGRPWFTFVLADLPLVTFVAEISVSWRLFDGDDVKLIIDNEVEYNSRSLFWRNWLWHAVPQQIFYGAKNERKTVTKNLPSALHYIELWADKTPTLHRINLNLGDIKQEVGSEQTESQVSPTVNSPKWTGNFSDDPDQVILARALFGEARKTLVPDEARVAIGWVIKNRVLSERWPNTYWEVITTPSQFSSFNTDDPNYPYVEDPLRASNEINKNAWKHAYEIAGMIINNEIPDSTGGANHYYDDSISTPNWAKNHKPTLVVTYINEYEAKATIFFYKL